MRGRLCEICKREVGNLHVEKCLPEGGGTLPQEHSVFTELLCRSGEGRGGDVYYSSVEPPGLRVDRAKFVC